MTPSFSELPVVIIRHFSITVVTIYKDNGGKTHFMKPFLEIQICGATLVHMRNAHEYKLGLHTQSVLNQVVLLLRIRAEIGQ